MSLIHGHSKRSIPAAFRDVKVIAHRGFHGVLPENSLVALQAAAADSFPVEFDVRCTKDGCLVVFHDSTLPRMTGLDGTIEDSTYDELKALRLRTEHGFSDEGIPRLKDVTECVDSGLLVEIKETPNAAEFVVPLVVAELARLEDVYDRVIIESFSPHVLQSVQAADPAFYRCQLFGGERDANIPWLVGFLRARLMLNWVSRPDAVAGQLSSLRARQVDRFRARYGYAVFAWTVRSKQDFSMAETLDVDSVISDIRYPGDNQARERA